MGFFVNNDGANRRSNRYCCQLLLLAAGTIVLFALLSWPLPRFFGRGIPSSAQNHEQPSWRYSIPGDHLQLLYHFDLMREMLTGRIPWFHNPYEFNTGDDEERFRPGAYFFPLSGVYTVLNLMTGQALAWNLTLWLSVLLSAFFTWGWLRRFTRDPAAITLGILVALLLPFRWISLFGGSPAGMALLWIPLAAWGVDVAVRDARPWSGAWIGFAVLMCFWGDLQLFYFLVLALPLFFLISCAAGIISGSLPWKKWWRVIPSGLIFLVVAVAYHLWRKQYLTESMMAGGRSLHEVALFSPARTAVLRMGSGVDGTVFFGVVTMIALAAAAVMIISAAYKNHPRARWQALLYAVVAVVTLATIILALGTNSPRRAFLLRQARDYIPYYEMIRQPFKIYALMPMWLGWLLAVGWTAGAFGESLKQRRMRFALAALLACGMLMEINYSLSATVSLIEPRQRAYEAVRDDARDAGHRRIGAIVVPLWPGESADTSLPLYYAQLYGLRLVNGYSPVVSVEYFENVFRRLESVNQGCISAEQLDYLLESGVNYLLLHENQFPEKVSPFPVTLTRDRLMAHQRLEFLAQDGPVWAFRLLDEPRAGEIVKRVPAQRFPTRRWNFDHVRFGDRRIEDAGAHGGAYLLLRPEDEAFTAGPWRVAADERLQWLLRVRGSGVASIGVQWAEEPLESKMVEIESNDWEWLSVPLPELPGFAQIRFSIEMLEGVLEADTGLLLLGEWSSRLETGEERVIEAADFFHAGYSEWPSQKVVFRPQYDPDTAVLYGPVLPLDTAAYITEWRVESDAAPGTDIGRLILHDYVTGERTSFPVRGGEPVKMEWSQPHSHLVNWIFEYRRVANVEIIEVILSSNAGKD